MLECLRSETKSVQIQFVFMVDLTTTILFLDYIYITIPLVISNNTTIEVPSPVAFCPNRPFSLVHFVFPIQIM